MLVAAYNDVGRCGDRAGEELVIVGVLTYRLGEGRCINNLSVDDYQAKKL